MNDSQNPKLWQHPHPDTTRTYEFQKLIEKKFNISLPDYEALRKWSINNLNAFWEEVWAFTGVVSTQPFRKVGYLHPCSVSSLS